MRISYGFAALAAAALALPAQAQSFSTASFGSSSGERVVTAPSQDVRHHGRMQVHVHRGYAAAYGYAGYNDYGDFDGNRSFDPDKWNDWWHDRPDRAYPRWMTRNSDCSRRWYSGDVLTC
jgi:hypothetical protein